ncbi:MAG: hypothetical protein ACREDR_37365 [Blastocatellia bacterium]
MSEWKTLPQEQVFRYDDWPKTEPEDFEVEFRLVFKGKLPSQSSRPVEIKHQIRKEFHKQLKELWNSHPMLKQMLQWPDYKRLNREDPGKTPTMLEGIADNNARCGFRFIPLIGGRFDTACGIDVLFLRRDQPGSGLFHSGGDIDNRIKVLFDALKMPRECNELGGHAPDVDENPFYCLVADDSLITEVKITTDRLLTPVADDERQNDVHLIIKVRTMVIGTRIPAQMESTFWD